MGSRGGKAWICSIFLSDLSRGVDNTTLEGGSVSASRGSFKICDSKSTSVVPFIIRGVKMYNRVGHFIGGMMMYDRVKALAIPFPLPMRQHPPAYDAVRNDALH